MYLRRVEAYGFKSFADRQVFEFGPGITSVVGPNGSGKSNVSDAIRWALGEQSARSIRARKTEDVIFTGSETRRQQSVAEVTLVLDNAEHWMPIDFEEVTVSRRAYRSGESEYRINGQKVRLLDVQDLFRRAQVGQNSYAMMSQGLVDEVLAMRPSERRSLIEEAADVHRHRIELTRAERRLAETRDNLGHVRITLRELSPRLRQLERQSERAARFRELDAQLGAALEAYYETELRRAQEALTAARATHDQRAEAYASAQRAAQQFQPQIAAAESAAAAARAELERAQRRERELAEEALRLEQRRALAEQRRELLLVRQQELAAGIAELQAAPDGGVPDEEALIALSARVEEAESELAAAREALSGADGAAREALRELAEAEARRTRLRAELQDAERRAVAAETRRRAREQQRAAAAERRLDLLDRLRDYGGRALAARRAGEALAGSALEATHRREVAERHLEEAQAVATEAREALRAATAEREALTARHGLIATLSATVVDRGSAAQALLRAAEQPEPGDEPLSGIVGLVSRLMRVPDGLEHAIEAALSEQVHAVVVEGEEDALAAVAYLAEHGIAGVTVLPLTAVPHQYPLNLFNERGVVGVASRLVKVEKEHRALIDTLLGRTIVVDDLETARRTVTRGLGSVVTRDGVLLRPNGSIFGGARGAVAEQFALQQEATELPAQIDAARQTEDAAAARVQRLDAAVEDVREALIAARSAATAAESARREHERTAGGLRRRVVAVAGELRLVHAALAADSSERGAVAPQVEIEALRRNLEDVEARLDALRDRADAVGGERDLAAERVADAAAGAASARGEREAQTARVQAAAEERRQSAERLRERNEQAAAVRRELEDLDLTLRDVREQHTNVQVSRQSAEEGVAPAHAALAEAEGHLRELGATRGDGQARLFAAERELTEAQTALRELATRIRTLQQQLADDGLAVSSDGSVRRQPPPQDAIAQPHPGSPSQEAETIAEDAAVGVPARGGADVDPEELRDVIAGLRGEIRALGPVNVEALDDLGEERERYDFLDGQVHDLEQAEGELREAIGELEKRIRERFDESFKEVDANFRDYFGRFFGGGHAELVIVEPEDEGGDAGVEVRAQPPGKRVSSINMLSGGERALTSVALLFALLAVNPAPVCVLDEVDAALDEANVGRFADTLREMCERSQFIVITHNRRTVEAADAIYGVSMGEDSTSQVLSMRVADLPRAS